MDYSINLGFGRLTQKTFAGLRRCPPVKLATNLARHSRLKRSPPGLLPGQTGQCTKEYLMRKLLLACTAVSGAMYPVCAPALAQSSSTMQPAVPGPQSLQGQ